MCIRDRYGPVEEEGFPLAVYIEKIVPFRHLLMGLPETFADPLTGIGADLMDIDPNDIDGALSLIHIFGEMESLLDVLASAIGALTNPNKLQKTFKSVNNSKITACLLYTSRCV